MSPSEHSIAQSEAWWVPSSNDESAASHSVLGLGHRNQSKSSRCTHVAYAQATRIDAAKAALADVGLPQIAARVQGNLCFVKKRLDY